MVTVKKGNFQSFSFLVKMLYRNAIYQTTTVRQNTCNNVRNCLHKFCSLLLVHNPFQRFHRHFHSAVFLLPYTRVNLSESSSAKFFNYLQMNACGKEPITALLHRHENVFGTTVPWNTGLDSSHTCDQISSAFLSIRGYCAYVTIDNCYGNRSFKLQNKVV